MKLIYIGLLVIIMGLIAISIFISIKNFHITIKLNKKIEENIKLHYKFFKFFYDLMGSKFIKIDKIAFLAHNHGDNPCTANSEVNVHIYANDIYIKKYGDLI